MGRSYQLYIDSWKGYTNYTKTGRGSYQLSKQKREGHTIWKTTLVTLTVQRQREGHYKCSTIVKGSYQLYNNIGRVTLTVQRECDGHTKCATTSGGSYQLYNDSGTVMPTLGGSFLKYNNRQRVMPTVQQHWEGLTK